ncbi:MAG: transposase [Lachnospiraceae bacterium]|nr:transposase [Lachnospiraceae bacterium]
MLPQTNSFHQTSNQILLAMKELQIGRLLRQANIRKACGIPVIVLFQTLILLAFQGKNLFRFLHSEHTDCTISKNAFYRFLDNPSFNWHRFLLLLATKITRAFGSLTGSGRVKMLVLDDSVLPRNRSKSVELLARIHDHVTHQYLRGFNLLALGWTDGFSFVPVSFNLLSSAKKQNRYREAEQGIDHQTNGWKARMGSMLQKPEAALLMIQHALDEGIEADYILMDSWFTTDPFVQKLRTMGLHVIGMVRNGKQRYLYQGRFFTLPQLAKLAVRENAGTPYRSLVARTRKHNVPVRIIFIQNQNKKSKFLYLLTTDLALSDDEVIRLYGNRWSIETFFKASKSLFRLCDEFQTRNYDSALAHTALVFTRYMVLEWIRRQESDQRTYGGLFFAMCEEVQAMELSEALLSLMALFVEIMNEQSAENTEIIKSKVTLWIASQSRYIRALLSNLCWES